MHTYKHMQTHTHTVSRKRRVSRTRLRHLGCQRGMSVWLKGDRLSAAIAHHSTSQHTPQSLGVVTRRPLDLHPSTLLHWLISSKQLPTRRLRDAGRNNYLSRPGQPDPLSNQIGAMVGLARKGAGRAIMYAFINCPPHDIVPVLGLQLGPLLYIMIAQGCIAHTSRGSYTSCSWRADGKTSAIACCSMVSRMYVFTQQLPSSHSLRFFDLATPSRLVAPSQAFSNVPKSRP